MEDHKSRDEFLLSTVREKFAKRQCCLICLKVVDPHDRMQHRMTVTHQNLVCCLKKEIHPYPCSKCEMRFSAKRDLVHHSLGHIGELVIDENNQMFSPVCCYLCRLPFKSEEELSTHCNTSVEHHLRREVILDMAFRECVALEILDINNVTDVEFEESTSASSRAVSEVQEDPSTSLLSWPVPSAGHMGHCSTCSVAVPISNMTEHIKGKKHIRNHEALIASCSKSTSSPTSGEILNSDQKNSSEVPSHSLNKSSGTFPKTEILASQDAVIIGNSTQISLQEEFEKLKISVEHDLNDYQVECETCGGVFQTFNNDVGLSVDLHVLNDPQHALATTIPLDRDAKQMGELIKTSTACKERSRRAVGPTYCPSCFQDISSLPSQARAQHLEKCNTKSNASFRGHNAKASSNILCTMGSENMTAGEKEHRQTGQGLSEGAAMDSLSELCDEGMKQGDKMCDLRSHHHNATDPWDFFGTVCSESMAHVVPSADWTWWQRRRPETSRGERGAPRRRPRRRRPLPPRLGSAHRARLKGESNTESTVT